MWMTVPKQMCDAHLLGEHVELHMLVGAIREGISLDGYIENGLVNLPDIRERHMELVLEMRNRGMNHKSPLPDYVLPHRYRGARSVVLAKSIHDLKTRCTECRRRINEFKKEL